MTRAIYTDSAQKAKLAAILHRAMKARSIPIAGDIERQGGHWYVRSGTLWIRSTDALGMERLK